MHPLARGLIYYLVEIDNYLSINRLQNFTYHGVHGIGKEKRTGKKELK